MSQISKALKKAQELRENEQGPQAEAMVPVVAVQQTALNSNMIIILTIGIVASVLISVSIFIAMIKLEANQNKVLVLENILNQQDKKINDLITIINNDKNMSYSQMHDISLRIENKTKDLKVKINNLASNSKDNYDNLKDAIVDDKQEIDFLNNYIKKLNQKIQAVSVSNTQAISQLSNKVSQITTQTQDIPNPSGGI